MKLILNRIFTVCYLTFGLQSVVHSQGLSHAPIKIETTIPYLKDLVSQASCHSKSFQVNSIIAIGNNPHTFHMTPTNRTAIAKANIVVAIGSEFEPWLSKVPKSKNQTWLNVTEGMALRKLDSNEPHAHDHSKEHHDDHSEDHHDDHGHLEYDPHIWQSPNLTKQALQKISFALIKIRPEEEQNIQSCTQEYLKKIDDEVVELKKSVETLPAENRIIATNHDALSYFANEFGFQIYSIVGLSDESAPTAKQLKKVISEVKNKKIPAVFLESTGNMRNIKTVSKETGVKIGGTLYGDSLGAKGSGAETALDMWRSNINTIINALKK